MNATVHQQVLDAIAQLPADEAEKTSERIAARRKEQFAMLEHAHIEVSNCADTLDLILDHSWFDRPDVPTFLRGPLQLVCTSLQTVVKQMGEAL